MCNLSLCKLFFNCCRNIICFNDKMFYIFSDNIVDSGVEKKKFKFVKRGISRLIG